MSYSSSDKVWADAAVAALERRHIRCWIAPRNITPGDEWGDAIVRGINGSRMLVLIFSARANASSQVRREVDRAISQGMIVMPIRIEDVRPEGGMEFSLSSTHWLDALTSPVERHLEKVARSVETQLGLLIEPPRARPSRDAFTPSPDASKLRDEPRTVRSRAIGVSLLGLSLAVVLGAAMFYFTKEKSPIPPAGPKRLAQNPSGIWSIERDLLVKANPGLGVIAFGDTGWGDYDLTLEAKSMGPDGFAVGFRASESRRYSLFVGTSDKKHSLGLVKNATRTELLAVRGTVRLREWHKVKVSLRGPRIRVELDDALLFDCTDNTSQRGRVTLGARDQTVSAPCRYRNIKVAAPDGTVLWEGLPDLSKK